MYIQEAAQSLLTAALNGSQLPNITERARQYILRCEELKKIGKARIFLLLYLQEFFSDLGGGDKKINK